MIRFNLLKIGAIVFMAVLVLFCSCEKHQLGELPEVQKDHTDIANASTEHSDTVTERPTAPGASANPTPAEFFPSATPR